MRLTTMPYKWSLSCWITNGMTRGLIGFGNWIYVALFTDQNIYRNEQDFHRVEGDRLSVSIDISTTQDTNHKGRKPLGLLQWLLEMFTKNRQWVIDPFLGSGTTLFVADRIGRKCYGGELSPEFCKETITRWNKTHIGWEAKKIEV